MKIKGLTIDQLQLCTERTGVFFKNARTIGNYVHFTLGLDGEKYRKHKGDRRINAVCWHGFRDFFMKVYLINREATIVTMIARYEDENDFIKKYPETGYINTGSMANPIEFHNACHCNEE